MKTLLEFYFEWDKMFDNRHEAEESLNDLFENAKNIGLHYGDCTSQNIGCKLCELTGLLEDYYIYTKQMNKL